MTEIDSNLAARLPMQERKTPLDYAQPAHTDIIHALKNPVPSVNTLLVGVFPYPHANVVSDDKLRGNRRIREAELIGWHLGQVAGMPPVSGEQFLALAPAIPTITIICGPNNAGKSRLMEAIVKYKRSDKPRSHGPASESLIVRTSTAGERPFITHCEDLDTSQDVAEDVWRTNSAGKGKPDPDADRLKYADSAYQHQKVNELLEAFVILDKNLPQGDASTRFGEIFESVFHRRVYILASQQASRPDRAGFYVSASPHGATDDKEKVYESTLRPVRLEVEAKMSAEDKLRYRAFALQCFRIDEVGKGMRNLLSLLITCFTTAAQYATTDKSTPMILGLDEPELGLHPPQAEYVGDVLASLAHEFTIHFVLTSHSPALLSGAFRMAQARADGGVICNLVRVTAGQDAGLHVLSSAMQVGGPARTRLGPHILSNVLQSLTHHFTVFTENENDAFLLRSATDVYLRWMTRRRDASAHLEHLRALEPLGFGGSIKDDLELTGDAAVTAASARIRGEILFCPSHGWAGVERYVEPLDCLGVRHIAWLDFDPVINVVGGREEYEDTAIAHMIDAVEQRGRALQTEGLGSQAREKEGKKFARNTLKEDGLRAAPNDIDPKVLLNDVAAIVCSKNAVFNPFGECESLVEPELGPRKTKMHDVNSAGSSRLLDTVLRLEELSQHDDAQDGVICQALKDNNPPWLRLLLVSVRWGLKCLFDKDVSACQRWAQKVILPFVGCKPLAALPENAASDSSEEVLKDAERKVHESIESASLSVAFKSSKREAETEAIEGKRNLHHFMQRHFKGIKNIDAADAFLTNDDIKLLSNKRRIRAVLDEAGGESPIDDIVIKILSDHGTRTVRTMLTGSIKDGRNVVLSCVHAHPKWPTIEAAIKNAPASPDAPASHAVQVELTETDKALIQIRDDAVQTALTCAFGEVHSAASAVTAQQQVLVRLAAQLSAWMPPGAGRRDTPVILGSADLNHLWGQAVIESGGKWTCSDVKAWLEGFLQENPFPADETEWSRAREDYLTFLCNCAFDAAVAADDRVADEREKWVKKAKGRLKKKTQKEDPLENEKRTALKNNFRAQAHACFPLPKQ